MTNTSEIAAVTAQQSIRDLFIQRLTHKVQTYIEALDALPAPKTLSDIERGAKAIIALARLINVVLPAPKPVKAKAPVPAPLLEDEDETEDAPKVVLNRQQSRRAEAMMRKTGP